ncbi:hypothetical protein K505DRAFT_286792 [Melanomma pulvis-pyrius CBS 109.77]|uniref:Large ribosomal subunit protein bL27m n=1 Tax=Melanomma pulvis-pyrius CBS 109.77 TaxID=1314802 RepID=A0A6A6WVD4_9PLEO|nr:hypothetical protein K505DRAFT_286792 [Melanomma pulvis-pyrius CBS 109.77]
MLLPRIFAPVRAAAQVSSAYLIPSSRVLDVLRTANGFTTSSPTLSFLRHASHQSQGRANGAKDGPGKRLGAKKSGGEYVIPGNIIFRQRGTAWFPGENCKFGRDHCIFSMASGYVRYYRDPLKHPKRQYIGVAFEKDEALPYPQNGARRRRLNMLPVKMGGVEVETPEVQVVMGEVQVEGGAEVETSISAPQRNKSGTVLAMGKKGYAFRESNWAIGRAAETANVVVKEFVPGDRFTAWQKSKARIALNEEKKRLRMAGKKTAKPKKKTLRN